MIVKNKPKSGRKIWS